MPYTQFNFILEIDGLAAAGFAEVSNLSSEVTRIEYRNGNDDTHASIVAGLSKCGEVTCKRGYTADNELWDWYKTVLNGQTVRKDAAVILLDESGDPAIRWEISNAFPSKIEGATLNATANEIAMETVVLAVEKIEQIIVA